MSRRLQIPGEREEAVLVAACEQALRASGAADTHTEWPEPGSYLAAEEILLGRTVAPDRLDALWKLQDESGGFPAWFGGEPQLDVSAKVWAAMRIAGLEGERVRKIASAVKSMGGVDLFAEETKVEWALLGLIPADRVRADQSAAARVLLGMAQAGRKTRELDLSQIGGSGMPAQRSERGLKGLWARIGVSGARRAGLEQSIETVGRQARLGWILDPKTRTAWLAAAHAGIQLEPLPASSRLAHAETFGGSIEATVRCQEADGSWRDDEGFIHGTWQALRSLQGAGYDDHEAEVLRGGEWLRSVQNADGGWGEDPAGAASASNVSHTAWALLGLIAGGDPASESATKGLEHLLAAQAADGAWRERPWTRTVHPGLSYSRDEARAQADARLAIEEFLKVTTGSRGTNG